MTTPDLSGEFAWLDADEIAMFVRERGWEDVEIVPCQCGMPGCRTAVVLGIASRAELGGLAETGTLHEYHADGRTPAQPAPPDQRFLAIVMTLVALPYPPIVVALEAGEDVIDAIEGLQAREDPRWLVLAQVLGQLLPMGLRDAIDGKMRRLTAS